MVKRVKKQAITLFDNYNGYDFEETKKELLECNNLDEISDESVWDCIRDMADEDFSVCKHELEDVFGDSRVIVSGTAGTWQGRFECAKIFHNILDALTACVEHCDYIKVIQLPSGLVKVESSHHDGTNVFYIKILNEKGFRLYDNWNFGFRTRLGNLKEYEVLEKIWNDSHYSRLPKRV